MKFRKYLIPVALLVCLFSTGFTRPLAKDVPVEIYLPYSGNYNHWALDLYAEDGSGTYYHFETDDDTFDSHILGSVAPGVYTIDFTSGYSSEGFDYGVVGPNYYHYHADLYTYSFHHALIEEGTTIYIDEGY